MSPVKNRANWPEEEANFSELFPAKMEGRSSKRAYEV